MKTCTRCKVEKSLSEYFADKRLKDGKESRCKACYYEARASYDKENRTFIRIRNRYGLDKDTYLSMIAHGCEACGTFERLNVDHDHETGKVRGILCHWCNTAEGQLKGDPDKALALAFYMLKHKNVLENMK